MTIIDVLTEQRLLAALICEPPVLAAADEIEVQDFTEFTHWVVFQQIRNLQAAQHDIGVLEIDDLLAERDKNYGVFLRPKCGAAFLGCLILDTEPYGHAVLWEHDMWWLRTLHARRRALEAAA